MAKISYRTFLRLEISIPIIVFALILPWSYAHFFMVPYAGLSYLPPEGEIVAVYVEPVSGQQLQVGDKLIQIGDQLWDEYYPNLSAPTLFAGTEPGEVVPLIVKRGNQELKISWEFPGPTRRQIIARLIDPWLLAYVFWIAGTATLLFVRPRNERRLLLAAFDFLIALWLASGSLSLYNVWKSMFVFTSTLWLFVPVTLHLNWVFPTPIKRLPAIFWVLVYSICAFLAVWVWFNPSITSTYPHAGLLAAGGGLLLTLLHAIFQPRQRRQVLLLLIAVGLAIAPAISLNILRLSDVNNNVLQDIALWSLPLIPAMYFFIVYRQQLGGLELRANRAVALILFGVMLFTLSLILIAASNTIFATPAAHLSFTLVSMMLAGLVGALIYPRFQTWVERHILGMPLPPSNLVEAYTTRISTSLESGQLVHLIRDDILPSLLIRQSALLRLESLDNGDGTKPRLKTVFLEGVDPSQLPTSSDIIPLLEKANSFRLASNEDGMEASPSWIRLVLPLKAEGRVIGICLLGRRDPDDYYAPNEIQILQVLMDQTALALVNIDQAERLHAFYQADIDRREEERKSLARELHDDVLGQLAMLAMSVDERTAGEQFSSAYQASVQRIREIISGLRPGMLNYGLYTALDELADETATQIGMQHSQPAGTTVAYEVAHSTVRYPPEVELHLYRIIQQACKNAVKHAHASHITIGGRLETGFAELYVKDDGIGFAGSDQVDLAELLAKKHFGLAGMYERAALIGAEVHINAVLGQGTQVRVIWRES